MPNGQLIPEPQPIVMVKPKTPYYRSPKFISLGLAAILLIFSLVLLNYFGIIHLTSKKQLIAQVNGEKLYKDQLEQAKGLFATLRSKDRQDPEVAKEALDFLIEQSLLDKEAQKRAIGVSELVNSRFEASISQYGGQKQLEQTFQTDGSTYKAYLTNQAIRQALEPIATKWRVVDYLSIRYLWNEDSQPEEKEYKNTALEKAQQFYQKIQAGLDIREAIKQRCQDPKINYLPFEDHNQIYLKTFNGTDCREQRINFKVSKDTNPDWGDDWLKLVFQLRQGELSPVIDYSRFGVGLFFIIKVLDEGTGDAFSVSDLVNHLKEVSDVKIYEQ